jgi:3-methyladenine DNA glycosylase AlkD
MAKPTTIDAKRVEKAAPAARKAAPAARKAAPAKRAAKKAAPAKRAAKKVAPSPASRANPADVATLIGQLERNGSSQFRADMSARYGIVTKAPAFGTPMAKIKRIARELDRDHALAEALWKTGIYEAQMLASLVDEPERVTPAQMNRWARGFDNWATVDTLCFNLFDRTPHAFTQAASWSRSSDEFVKRAAFALLASAALHGHGTDADFARALPLVEEASGDARNFVKKGVSWALRAIGLRGGPKVRAQARALAQRLATSDVPSARWIGKDALKELAK